jgi:hypothetical protein
MNLSLKIGRSMLVGNSACVVCRGLPFAEADVQECREWMVVLHKQPKASRHIGGWSNQERVLDGDKCVMSSEWWKWRSRTRRIRGKVMGSMKLLLIPYHIVVSQNKMPAILIAWKTQCMSTGTHHDKIIAKLYRIENDM